MKLDQSLYDSTKTVESKRLDGVSFVIKRLTVPQRAQIELDTEEAQAKHQELGMEYREIRDDLKAAFPLASDGDEESVDPSRIIFWQQAQDAERQQAAKSASPDVQKRIARLILQKSRVNTRFGLISQAEIQPKWLRSGTVSITGLTVGDKPITVEQVIARGPAELADEIYEAIHAEAYMSQVEQKNSQSPTSSGAVEAPATNNSIAPSASETNGGESSAATASATSQTS